jgi:hypothetical protein
MPGVVIEDAGEHRRAVEPRQAQPADGPIPVNERRRVAVGQEPVVGDWL